MSNYFDLHCHPAFKSFLTSHIPEERENCWKKLGSLIASKLIASQSCLDQMKDGGVNLAVSAIVPMESPFIQGLLFGHLAPLLTFASKDVLQLPTYSHYYELLQEELAHLKRSQNYDPASGKTFKILNSMEDYAPNQMNLILAIEGAHALESEQNLLPSEVLIQLKENYEQRYLYLTLTHLTHYTTATHAYGMTLMKNARQFRPHHMGITPKGKEMIDIAYNKDIGGYHLLIDIKHMSLVSRRQFYEYRKNNHPNVPIMASHMGVTGISWKNTSIAEYFDGRITLNGPYAEVHYKKPEGIGRRMGKKTFFNPWSINLYNEEIIEIIESKGLLGISLDQRIVGASQIKGEVFSKDELNYILKGYKDLYKIGIPGDFTDEDEDQRSNQRNHTRHFCNQILHIIKTAGEKAWNHICIGSDFDGLIDPINSCKNSSEFPDLEKLILEILPEMMEEDDTFDYDMNDIEGKVRKLMFENARNFLDVNFGPRNPPVA